VSQTLILVASYSLSLADPNGSNALVAAVAWLEGTLLGTIALTLAILAVASVGFGMLSGRVPFRRGLTVVAGCFVLFGASNIIAGIQTSIRGQELSGAPVAVVEPQPVVIPTPSTEDPYAGAAPKRRR
jgi:type IV secretory pathway VirB2 component (pilin)